MNPVQLQDKAGPASVRPPPVPARPLGLYHPLPSLESASGTSSVTNQLQFEMKDYKCSNEPLTPRTNMKTLDVENPSRIGLSHGKFAGSVGSTLLTEKEKKPEELKTPCKSLTECGTAKTKSKTISHHSFFSDGSEVKHMEGALLELLDDFRSGKLRAFGNDGSLEQMVAIRDQQEKLAKMHFDLVLKHSKNPSSPDEPDKNSFGNMKELINGLEQLSVAIERLHSSTEDGGDERTSEEVA